MLKSMRKSKNRFIQFSTKIPAGFGLTMSYGKKSPFSRTAAHIFVSPGEAPGAITLNVVWLEREFDAYKLIRCICPSNYNRF